MSLVDSFQRNYQLLISKVTSRVYDLIQAGQTKEQIISVISTDQFRNAILNDSKFKASTNTLNALYLRALNDIDQFADVDPQALQALAKVNRTTFITKLSNDVADNIQANLTTGVLGGLSKEEVIEAMNVNLRPDQIETLVTTAINTYTASVVSLMADKLPDNTAYVYRGPIDEKTRPICLDLMSRGEMTKAEINRLYPGKFIDRGGFNCRHQWAISTTRNPMHSPKAARAEAKDRGVPVG